MFRVLFSICAILGFLSLCLGESWAQGGDEELKELKEQLKKVISRGDGYYALVAAKGKDPVLHVDKSPITTATTKGAKKSAEGKVHFKDKQFTFEVKEPPPGLAMQLQRIIKVDCKLNYPVTVSAAK